MMMMAMITVITNAGECAVCATRKEIEIISDGGDSGNKKWKRSYGGAYGGVRG
jgi:hypothetical protein